MDRLERLSQRVAEVRAAVTAAAPANEPRDSHGRWTMVGVRADEVEPGDRINPAGTARVHAVRSVGGRVALAYKVRGSRAPGVDVRAPGDVVHVRRPVTAKGDVLDARSTRYGMQYDSANARRPHVLAAKAYKGWDDLPTVDFRPKAQPLHANEEFLHSATVERVVSGGEPLRPGYDPHVLIDTRGHAHVIDGHHRVAMHLGLHRDVMPSKVWDVRERGPIPTE